MVDADLVKTGVRASRIATLREIAAELNARADVLEAVEASGKPTINQQRAAAGLPLWTSTPTGPAYLEAPSE